MPASTSAVTIDALPYYDTDLDTVQGLRERLEAEIEQELHRLPEDGAVLASGLPEELPSLFSTSTFLGAELDRVTNSKAVIGLDSVRYQLPAPPLNAPSAAWKKAIDNAGSQLEHQSARLANLDVMGKYASNSWRVANYLVEKEIERLQTRVDNVKDATEEVNRERKAKQLETGTQLSALETRWKTLISGNIQLELANMQIEMEVDMLREREGELKTQLAQM